MLETNINHINITLDIFSICICLLLCVYLLNKDLTNTENNSFVKICFFNIIFILGDLTDWCCNGLAKPWYPAVLHIGQFIYYLSVIPLVYFLLKYIYCYLSKFKKISIQYLQIAKGISVIHLAGSILTLFFGAEAGYYEISKANIYSRGNLTFIACILPFYTYIVTLVLTIQCWKFLSKRTINALLSYAYLPFIGHLIQILFRGVGTLVPSITLSLLFIFINVQLDSEVQLEKNKQELTEAQIAVMLSQIQPHFLYNTLTTIRYLCGKDPETAKECINDLSIFLRANMNSLTNSMPIPLTQELDYVNSYLKLEQQRFGDLLSVKYNFKTLAPLIPSLSLQPLVENAVRHGIRRKENGGTVIISSIEDEHSFYIIVEDNGIGFDTDIMFSKNHVGIENVRKRLQMVCNGRLEIESTIGVGTKVTMIIPK